jgi:hypothetical protein
MNMVCFNLYGDPALSLAIKPVKWLQIPDMTDNGIDIRCSRDRLPPGPMHPDPYDPNLIVPWDLADDFECNRPGPITGVVFWGSWISDVKGDIQKIRLSIYDDIPDMDGPGPMYSMPGEELWSKDFYAGEFTESLFYTSLEQGEWFWLQPPSPSITQAADRQVWLYHVPINAQDAFIQRGDPCNPVIYWLGIHALLEIDPNFKPRFGWKTRDPYPPGTPGQLEYCHFNDDAVRSNDDCNTWAELRYPSVHPYAFNVMNPDANSIDMAFAIISFEQEIPEPLTHLKWSQPPIEIDPNTEMPVYCGWDEKSYVSGVYGWSQRAKLKTSDCAVDDLLGWRSVGICGDTAVIGAHGDDDKGSASGSAYTFCFDGSSWAQQAKLLASDGTSSDLFGWSVAIDDDTIVVGARNDADKGSFAGSAYVFTPNDVDPGNWVQRDKLLASDGAREDYFGVSAAICDDTIVVGADMDDDNGINSGSAYVFTPNVVDPTDWVQRGKLLASDGAIADWFGGSVAIDVDTVVVGAWGNSDNGLHSGSAYIFKKPVGGWADANETVKLLPSDGGVNHAFGYAVAISGDTIVIGAPLDDDNGTESGSAYVFTPNDVDPTKWDQQAKLLASDGVMWDRFGYSVAISGDTVVVGAFHDCDNGASSGSAYVFRYNGSKWVEEAKLLPSDGAAQDWFGHSVAISGDKAVVGAPYNDANGLRDAGSAYAFTTSGSSYELAADDFHCLGSMPITSVHWWGSYVGWDYSEPPPTAPVAWHVGFWSNIADLNPNDPNTYSYPEQLLWEIELSADRVEVDWAGYDQPSDPCVPVHTCFKYYVDLEPDEYFWQDDYNDLTEDDIFWLSVAAVYSGEANDVNYPWGWKTRPQPWMDNAVKFEHSGTLQPGILPDACQAATYTPVDDTTIDQYLPNKNHGTGNYLIVRTAGTGFELDTLLKFDISSIPASASISSARIRLYYFHWNDVDPVGRRLTTHRITSAWDEATTKWSNRPSFHATATSSLNMPGAFGWLEWDVTSDVQDFVSGSNTNYGWHIRNASGSYPWPMIYFRSKEYVDPNYHPQLEVEYEGPGPFEPIEDPIYGESYDMAFELDTDPAWIKAEQPFSGIRCWAHYEDEKSTAEEDASGEPNIIRPVADDWLCDQNTPITAVVWWGSYIGYRYKPCEHDPCGAPLKPAYFLLSIWDDIPADPCDPNSYSHPDNPIWEYRAYNYDEVLVGYDKHPEDQNGPPREPVFRYSVRLPKDDWFIQPEQETVFWLSIVAVYSHGAQPSHDWGWTNHKHTFNDNAVAGTWDNVYNQWIWGELYDQAGQDQDMSFVLFTLPKSRECSGCADYNSDGVVNFEDYGGFADDWRWVGQPGSYNRADLNCDGTVDFHDLQIFAGQWLGSCP